MITAAIRSATLDHQPFVRREPLAHPFVSIVVPVYNNSDGVKALLRALAAQTYPVGSFECLLVDNGSDAPLPAPADPGFECRVLREPRPGSYAARNCGVAAARGEILAFTDSDCRPDPDWLQRAVDALESLDGPGMLGGRIKIVCRDEERPTAVEYHNAICGFPQEQYVVQKHFAATANLVCHRELFDRVGDFDATLYSSGDFEWGSRVHAAGYRQVFAHDVLVTHPALANVSQFWKKYRRISGGVFQVRRRQGWSMPRLLMSTLVASIRRWRLSCRDERCRSVGDRLSLAGTNALLCAMFLFEMTRLWCGGKPFRG